MKAALISNVNVESLARRIEGHEVFIAGGYGAWTQELANPSSDLWSFDPSAVFLLLDGAELALKAGDASFEGLAAALDEHLSWIQGAAESHPSAKIFVSTLDVPRQWLRSLKSRVAERHVEHHWYARLTALSEALPNMYAFDVKAIVETIGRPQFYSAKRWYVGGMRYGIQGEKDLAREMTRMLDVLVRAGKKLLVLDLDHTLWGGIVGEDGINGIALSATGPGARYKDFQRRVRQLKELGVILAVVSKNNEADVLEVFDKHPDMVLRKDDFAMMKVNWAPKPQNIAELAQDLDLGTDSFVFIDDNPVEREAVRSALPDVVVPEFPADTCDLPQFLEQIQRDHFFVLAATEEDRKRTETYLQNAKRSVERNAAGSVEEFLAALKTKITLGRVTDDDVARAAQLTQKTNQFNLTTRRYTEQDVQRFRNSRDYSVYLASVSDKYGDNGKVLLAIVHKVGNDTAELDTFLMSCRVMGRFIEDQVLDHLVRELRGSGVSKLLVHYTPTKKNPPAKAFCERLQGGVATHGAQDPQQGTATTTWTFDLTQGSPVTTPAYAEIMSR